MAKNKEEMFKIISKKINQGFIAGKTEHRKGYGTVDEILEAVKLYQNENNVKLYAKVTKSGNVVITKG